MTDNLLDQNDDPLDPTKNYLEELVGEGKKFKSPEDLARGKYEADLYVKTLIAQKDELRNDYLKLREESMARAKLEELIDQLDKRPPQQANHEQPPVNEAKDSPLDPKQIESLVSKQMQEFKLTEKQQENFKIVQDKLKERFGNNYQSVIKEQIENMGLTADDINALAKKSPTAFFRTLGLDQPKQEDSFQSPPRSSQRSDNFAPKGGQKRTWSYYQELKKANPRLYLDPKIAVQMHNDHQTLGADFEDGDFNRFG